MVTPTSDLTPPAEAERQAVTALYATGHWLLSIDRARAALDVFRTLILVAPTDERGWLGLGEAHERLDGPEIAAHLYRVGCRAAPRSSRCQVARARVLARLDLREEARAALDAAQAIAESRRDDPMIELVDAERTRLS
jgi:hypothetical protein